MLILIPESGVIGEGAMREAAAGEFRHIVQLLRTALVKKLYAGTPERYIDIEAAYSDRVVIRQEDRFYSYPYTLTDDNQIQLGERQEVVLDFQIVAMREAVNEGKASFIEALDDKGTKWRIRVIEEGWSGNGWFYANAVLREAAPLFNGSRVFNKTDEEHIKGQGKSFGNLIGGLSNAQFIESKNGEPAAIYADLDVLLSAGDVPAKMREAYDRNMSDNLFGFSIDVKGKYKIGTADGRRGRIATSMNKVDSVDLIIEPGAGGRLVSMIEAVNPEEQTQMALKDRMVATIQAANKGALPEGLDIENEEALEASYREAVATPSKASTTPKPAQEPVGVSREELEKTVRMVEARAYARNAIDGSKLPDKAKIKLQKQFEGDATFRESNVDDAIKEELDYLANFIESGHVSGGGMRIEAGEDRSAKVAKMMDSFFDPNNRDVTSFRECYVEVTGDTRVTGDFRQCDYARMREAVAGPAEFREALSASSWSNVLGDGITRAMIADYRTPSVYDAYKQFIGTPVPVNDFRIQERTRFGGYGDLPVVAENGNYNPLVSPTDEAATYSVSKRGGKETISLEMTRNDDVGAIRRIPTNLSRSGKRTVSKFVFDFIRLNPLIYDTVALFHATHSAAISATSIAAGRLAMKNQTELDSGDKLGIGPRFLLCSDDSEEAAVDLFRRNTENDKNFVQSLALTVLPVWYWTDPNDWALVADPLDVPTVELAFLDGNEEPELFVQDNPTSGSLFSNDQITYKIRHIYGGNVLDYRGMYKSVVV